MNQNDKMIVLFAEGKARNFAKAQNKTLPYIGFMKYFKKPYVTPEKRKEFNRLSKEEQDNLKSIAGWYSGAQCSDGYRNLRNILPRNIATIDMDYVPDYVPDQIETGCFGLSDIEFFAHSSRRHTPEEPRIRIILPLSRRVDRDEYSAVIRLIGQRIDPDMKLVDPVSYRPAQMMFFPTCSKDDEKHYFFFRNEAEVLDVDAMLAEFEEKIGDWRDLSLLPRHPDEDNLRRRADRAEDPTEKEGIIGDFCRAYTIFDVMDEFLPGVYLPGDEKSGHPRYTYAGSTSSNGAIVYDDGKFIYSHHGHDPGCDMNLNAFDFLRIHKFGDLDTGEKSDKKVTELPSFRAAAEFAETLQPVRKQRVARNYDLRAMFDDAGIEPEGDIVEAVEYDPVADLLGDIPAPKPKKKKEPETDDEAAIKAILADLIGDDVDLPPLQVRLRSEPRPLPPADEDWLASEVEMTAKGEIISNLPNVAAIVYNDPRLRGSAAFNEFTQRLVCTRSVKSNIKAVPVVHCDDAYNGSPWQDIFDTAVRALLEYPNGKDKAGYGMKVTDRDLVGGISLAAQRNKFHPVKDYLKSAKAGTWEAVETMLIRYLGLEDNAYHREVSANIMLASVARIFNPGHKFDFAPIIVGRQGRGKSTFIKVLYGADWFGEIACKLDDKQDIAEELAGKWGCELPELSAFHKSDHNAAKMFLRRQHDDVRMAYDRRVSILPRQSVFWGTTNDIKFLKDPTGNRSYWVLLLGEGDQYFDLAALADEREALWGAAYAEWVRRTGGQTKHELDLSLRSPVAREIARELQEGARTEEVFEQWRDQIEMWLEDPVPMKQFLSEIGKPLSDFPGEDDEIDPNQLVLRCVFRNQDALAALNLPQNLSNPAAVQSIQKAVAEIDGWNTNGERRRVLGILGRWRTRIGATQGELLCGYRLYKGAL